MIDDGLRELVPHQPRLAPSRKQHIKEQLMHQIHSEHPIESKPPMKRWRSPKRRVAAGLVAATIMATGGAAAATFGFGSPDPQQAAQVIENSADRAAVHGEGWRPVLRSEFVACVGADSDKLTDPRMTGNTPASEFPLTELLTRDRLVEECTTGNDWARSQGGFDSDAASVCVRESEYLLAVVALDGLDCADTGDRIRPMTDDDLARLNTMRAFEVAVLANPEPCPSLDNAVNWAQARIDEHGEKLGVRGIAHHDEGCYGPLTMWDWGEVVIEQVSGPALAPTDPMSSTTAPPATTPLD